MYLPSGDPLVPNVNVQVQAFDGTIEDYAAVSRQQLQQIGWTSITDEVSESSVVVEYSGSYQGTQMHWYAKASV